MELEEIFSFENLYEAHKKCRVSKQHKGEVIRFEANLSFNITSLINEILSKKYKLGKYKMFYIYEPKERLIEALPYKDRVVIRCFCDNCLRPKVDKKLIYDNAACRRGKGTKFAIDRLKLFLRKTYLKEKNNNFYFLKCDIKKYFPSINHEKLIKILKKFNFSNDEIWMIQKFIKEQPNNKEIGLPLGNQSSQWFALVYLNVVDRFIKEKLGIKCYIRYMDDMILIHKDKETLRTCKNKIEKICKEELELSLNEKTQIGKVKDGIDFLGYRFILSETGKIITKLRGSSFVRLKSHVKNIEKLRKGNIVDDEYVLLRYNAFYNHIKAISNCRHLKCKVHPKSI